MLCLFLERIVFESLTNRPNLEFLPDNTSEHNEKEDVQTEQEQADAQNFEATTRSISEELSATYQGKRQQLH